MKNGMYVLVLLVATLLAGCGKDKGSSNSDSYNDRYGYGNNRRCQNFGISGENVYMFQNGVCVDIYRGVPANENLCLRSNNPSRNYRDAYGRRFRNNNRSCGFGPFAYNGNFSNYYANSYLLNQCSQYNDPIRGTYSVPQCFAGTGQCICVEYASQQAYWGGYYGNGGYGYGGGVGFGIGFGVGFGAGY